MWAATTVIDLMVVLLYCLYPSKCGQLQHNAEQLTVSVNCLYPSKCGQLQLIYCNFHIIRVLS